MSLIIIVGIRLPSIQNQPLSSYPRNKDEYEDIDIDNNVEEITLGNLIEQYSSNNNYIQYMDQSSTHGNITEGQNSRILAIVDPRSSEFFEGVIIPSALNDSYETLMKQIYGIHVELPNYLVINDSRVGFIDFQNVINLRIKRWIIDPIMQSWAGPPSTLNRIITLFGTTGTYLVKARYDPKTNQIFPPI